MTRFTLLFTTLLLSLTAVTSAQAPSVAGAMREWQVVELTFAGPDVLSETGSPNPFTDYRFNARFTGPNGAQFIVPGFFAADGDAAETSANSGNAWTVHFLPDQPGTWNWEASFRTGSNVAVALDFDVSGAPVSGSFDGDTGSFTVNPADPLALENRHKGALRVSSTEHYLQFSNNRERFLKGGANSPENLLGYFEFDGTFDLGGVSPATSDGLHHFDAHFDDFSVDDTQDLASIWQGSKGRRLIGAVNYLAEQGVNAMYFLTYSSDGGDSQDTWPWVNPTGSGHKLRFDVSKLAQWEKIFSHMDARGILLHVILQELENDQVMGGLTTERMLYHRELIARFGHHQALQWNIGEENDSTATEQIAFADHIRALDAYAHPVAVHNQIGKVTSTFSAVYGTSITSVSLQSSPSLLNKQAKSLRSGSANAGTPMAVFADEQFAPSINQSMSNLDEMRQDALWGNLMGGGAGVEWFFDFADATVEDFTFAAPLWDDTAHALNFFRSYVYVDALTSHDQATVETDDYVLREPGETYVIFRQSGGGATLLVPDFEPYTVQWYDPRLGGSLQLGSVPVATATLQVPGGFYGNLDPDGRNLLPLNTGAPPYNQSQDWVILVRKQANRAPVMLDQNVGPSPVSKSGPIVLRLWARDPDGPDDIRDIAIAYSAPGGILGTAVGARRGGDLATISRNSVATLLDGTWIYLAVARDFSGVLSNGLPGTFTIVP